MTMNGDTWIEADLQRFLAEHRQTGSLVSMICVRVPNVGRYGRVEIDGAGRVLSFREKDGLSDPGWINGGVYLFRSALLENISTQIRSGSLEHDVLGRLPSRSIHAFCTEGKFLDIGTPEDLAAAEGLLTEAR